MLTLGHPASAIAFLAPFACQGLLAVSYSEDNLGDLADSFDAPTLIVLDGGVNRITATVREADDDFFTLRVPAGRELSSIDLFSYNHRNVGNESFLGFQRGAILDRPPADLAQGDISFVLIGADRRGTSLNSLFALNPSPASGTLPLPAGDYSFWLNETDDLPASLSLGFEVTSVPEPSAAILLTLATLGLTFSRVRKTT